jgi:hypothetical protein
MGYDDVETTQFPNLVSNYVMVEMHIIGSRFVVQPNAILVLVSCLYPIAGIRHRNAVLHIYLRTSTALY